MRTNVMQYLLSILTAITMLPLIAFAQQLPAPGWLALKTASGYRQAARYPASSVVLEAGAEDPIRVKRRPSKIGRVPAACGYYFETSPMPPE